MRFVRGGMTTFFILWFGQSVSLVGTAMTRFALLTWAYQQTGEATTIALLGFFSFVLFLALSPLAGVLVDRWDRRIVMLATDFGAGLMTIIILLLYGAGSLEIWHLFILEALAGGFEAFQRPAYSASTTMLVAKHNYGRIAGLRSFSFSAAQILAPVAAGLLLPVVDINGVMLIDVATFIMAAGTLLIIRIPAPPPAPDDSSDTGNLWRDMQFGARYIFQRKGLFGVTMVFFGMHLFAALTYFSIMPAMILARSGGDKLALATAQAGLGIGGVVGGIVVAAWGGPKRRIHGIFLGAALSFLFGDLLFAVGRSVAIWFIAGFVSTFFIAFISSADRSLWQSKVPPKLQGRVLSARSMLAEIPMPLGYLLAGPLADRLLEPAMRGGLADLFGGLVGTGDGSGMAVMFLATGILGALMSLSGYLFRPIRRLEDDLPDYDEAASSSEVAFESQPT
jgi:MFS family permease